MVDVVVGVDDELDRELRELADFREHLFCGFGIFKRVDDRDAVVADDEARVGAGIAFGVVDGGVDVVAERFQGEGKGGWGRCLRAPSGAERGKSEQTQGFCDSHGSVSYLSGRSLVTAE